MCSLVAHLPQCGVAFLEHKSFIGALCQEIDLRLLLIGPLLLQGSTTQQPGEQKTVLLSASIKLPQTFVGITCADSTMSLLYAPQSAMMHDCTCRPVTLKPSHQATPAIACLVNKWRAGYASRHRLNAAWASALTNSRLSLNLLRSLYPWVAVIRPAASGSCQHRQG